MPRVIKEMSDSKLRALTNDGATRKLIAVGGVTGLCIRVSPKGENGDYPKSWVLRTSTPWGRRDYGLGSYPDVPLAKAREKARAKKEQIEAGIDPVAEKRQTNQDAVDQKKREVTFGEAVRRYLPIRFAELRSQRSKKQWESTLLTYAIPVLGNMVVGEIKTEHVLKVLQPIWISKTETADRLRNRIKLILDWAKSSGLREGDNPAAWDGNLKDLLPAPSKVKKVVKQPSLQIEDLPRWITGLRTQDGTAKVALEFALLTAVRSQEVRGANWVEIDWAKKIWEIPAARMKMKKSHRVPLTEHMLALLEQVRTADDLPPDGLIFSAPRGGEMSDNTLRKAMQRLHEKDQKDGGPGFIDKYSRRPAVPHGLRASFRTWIAEETKFPSTLAEAALAHNVGDDTERSYNRGDLLERRREMMDVWCRFVNDQHVKGGRVVRFRAPPS